MNRPSVGGLPNTNVLRPNAELNWLALSNIERPKPKTVVKLDHVEIGLVQIRLVPWQ